MTSGFIASFTFDHVKPKLRRSDNQSEQNLHPNIPHLTRSYTCHDEHFESKVIIPDYIYA